MLCVGNSKATLLAELQSASPRAKLEPWQPARSALEADCSLRSDVRLRLRVIEEVTREHRQPQLYERLG